MSERHGYPHGVPHWTTCLVRDVDRAADFYGQIFGWDFDISPDHRYAVATLHGLEVAGIGTLAAAGAQPQAAWMTEIRVDDAAAAADAVIRAGGSVLAGPMDMSPASVLTVVADPAGAVLCATQPVGRAGAQLVNEPGTWTMSALSTPDPSAVADFYRDVFGWESERFGPMTLWRLPGYVGGEPSQPVARDVIAAARPSNGPPRWDVDFRIADADAAARAAHDAGGTVLVEPADQDSVPFRQAVLTDPDGAVFSVSQLHL